MHSQGGEAWRKSRQAYFRIVQGNHSRQKSRFVWRQCTYAFTYEHRGGSLEPKHRGPTGWHEAWAWDYESHMHALEITNFLNLAESVMVH